MQEIQCPKCQQLIQKIVVMECEHHLCIQCAAKIFNTSKIFNSHTYSINCEFCSHVTNIQQSTAQSLISYSEQNIKQRKLSRIIKISNPTKQVKQILYCETCQYAICSIEDYLKSEHRAHLVKNIKDKHFFMPLLNDSKAKLNETILKLCTQSKEKENTLQYLMDKKKIQITKIENCFSQLKRNVQEKELECLKLLEEMFVEPIKYIEKAIKDLNSQIFKIQIKFNEVNELIRDKEINNIFRYVEKQKGKCYIPYDQNTRDNKIQVNIKQIESNTFSINDYLKEIQKYRSAIPVYKKQLGKESTLSIHDQTGKSQINTINNNNSHLKLLRSNTTLGPSLLKLEKMTPIQNLIETLDKKIKKNSQRINIGSPRSIFNPTSQIRRLFSP